MFSFLYWRPFFQVTSCSNRFGLLKEYFKIWLSMWREQEIKGSKNGYFTKFWLFSIYSWNWGEIKFYNFLGSKVIIWRNIFFICSISYWNAPNWSTRCGFEGCGFLNIIALHGWEVKIISSSSSIDVLPSHEVSCVNVTFNLNGVLVITNFRIV